MFHFIHKPILSTPFILYIHEFRCFWFHDFSLLSSCLRSLFPLRSTGRCAAHNPQMKEKTRKQIKSFNPRRNETIQTKTKFLFSLIHFSLAANSSTNQLSLNCPLGRAIQKESLVLLLLSGLKVISFINSYHFIPANFHQIQVVFHLWLSLYHEITFNILL